MIRYSSLFIDVSFHRYIVSALVIRSGYLLFYHLKLIPSTNWNHILHHIRYLWLYFGIISNLFSIPGYWSDQAPSPSITSNWSPQPIGITFCITLGIYGCIFGSFQIYGQNNDFVWFWLGKFQAIGQIKLPTLLSPQIDPLDWLESHFASHWVLLAIFCDDLNLWSK